MFQSYYRICVKYGWLRSLATVLYPSVLYPSPLSLPPAPDTTWEHNATIVAWKCPRPGNWKTLAIIVSMLGLKILENPDQSRFLGMRLPSPPLGLGLGLVEGWVDTSPGSLVLCALHSGPSAGVDLGGCSMGSVEPPFFRATVTEKKVWHSQVYQRYSISYPTNHSSSILNVMTNPSLFLNTCIASIHPGSPGNGISNVADFKIFRGSMPSGPP